MGTVNICGRLMVLHRCHWWTVPGNIQFNMAHLWIQLQGLPVGLMSDEIAHTLLDSVGNVTEVMPQPPLYNLATTIRARAWVDLSLPLVPGCYIPTHGQRVVWVAFRYECIMRFCKRCGRVGHTTIQCRMPLSSATQAILDRFHRLQHEGFCILQDPDDTLHYSNRIRGLPPTTFYWNTKVVLGRVDEAPPPVNVHEPKQHFNPSDEESRSDNDSMALHVTSLFGVPLPLNPFPANQVLHNHNHNAHIALLNNPPMLAQQHRNPPPPPQPPNNQHNLNNNNPIPAAPNLRIIVRVSTMSQINQINSEMSMEADAKQEDTDIGKGTQDKGCSEEQGSKGCLEEQGSRNNEHDSLSSPDVQALKRSKGTRQEGNGFTSASVGQNSSSHDSVLADNMESEAKDSQAESARKRKCSESVFGEAYPLKKSKTSSTFSSSSVSFKSLSFSKLRRKLADTNNNKKRQFSVDECHCCSKRFKASNSSDHLQEFSSSGVCSNTVSVSSSFDDQDTESEGAVASLNGPPKSP